MRLIVHWSLLCDYLSFDVTQELKEIVRALLSNGASHFRLERTFRKDPPLWLTFSSADALSVCRSDTAAHPTRVSEG